MQSRTINGQTLTIDLTRDVIDKLEFRYGLTADEAIQAASDGANIQIETRGDQLANIAVYLESGERFILECKIVDDKIPGRKVARVLSVK